MRHPIRAALAISCLLLVSACSAADWEYFEAAGPGDWSAVNPTVDPSQYSTVARQCAGSGRTIVSGASC